MSLSYLCCNICFIPMSLFVVSLFNLLLHSHVSICLIFVVTYCLISMSLSSVCCNILLYSHVTICLISGNRQMEPVLASGSKHNLNFSQIFKSAICMPVPHVLLLKIVGNTMKSNLYYISALSQT